MGNTQKHQLAIKLYTDKVITESDIAALDLFNPFYIKKLMQLPQIDLKLKLREVLERHSIIQFESERVKTYV